MLCCTKGIGLLGGCGGIVFEEKVLRRLKSVQGRDA